MGSKFALIIGNTEYADPGLAQLTAPGKDAEDFARVLKDQDIGAFDEVNILLNQPEYIVRGTIDEFFDQKKPDDLLVLYFSGHGVRDELGALYLAVKNTNRFRLRSTALKSDFIREAMDQSRSKRQVLILDCCNSGAFSQGTKAATGVSIGTATAFEAGYGRIILTASDSTQFAWEGNQVIGETDNSLFTHFLVEGLKGEADLDGDGRITVDELYDFAYEKVKIVTPKQTPSKFSSKQQGEIVLRQGMRIEDIKPVSLPTALLDTIENPFADIRLGAAQQLIRLLNGNNLGLARSAREALEKMAAEDDSVRVRQVANQALESIRQAETVEEERKAREEAERVAAQKAEEERIVLEKAEAERKAKQEAERLLAEQKAEEERKAKKEAKRLAASKAKEERLALEKAEVERKAQEEAERLSAEQKAEEVRKTRAEANRIAIQKAEQERLKREKAVADRLAKKKAEEDRLANEKRIAEEKTEAKRGEREEAEKVSDEVRPGASPVIKEQAKERVAAKGSKPAKMPWLTPATLVMLIMALILSGFAAIKFLPGIFGGSATLTPSRPLVLAGTPLPFTSQEITTQNTDGVVQLARWGKGTINQIAYSPGWEELAVASSLGIYLYDANTLAQINLIESDSWITSIAFSPDGGTLASGSYDNTIRLWNVSDGSLLQTLEGHTESVESVAFSPDGGMLASVSSNYDDSTIRLWSISDGSLLQTLEGHTNGVLSVAFSPDGGTLASGSDDATIRLWNVSDGLFLQLWNIIDGAPLLTIDLGGYPHFVHSVAFSPNGRLLASGAEDGTIRLWGIAP